MSSTTATPTPPPMSPADRLAHDLASYVRRPLMAEHDKTKEPLSPRHRGPHPYRAGVVAS
ncbi:hypothetical protein OG762_36750 [Streptomyces sp. NBC_01136]|uniref:hypothetical protein n=1 Tax=Streptomyces sp. NBC_01136 TaxID=2903754 RepID=UPI00386736D0|nr:hypothetical protein OG762_36750 [Streptomyces sp. NBC_01136]